MSDYHVKYYRNSRTGKEPVLEYITRLRDKEQTKIASYIVLLQKREGKLVFPYCRHIEGKIWELRIQFSPNNHRILYDALADKLIVLLHAFAKKTEKLPTQELTQAYNNFEDTLDNINYYYEKTN